MIRVAFAGRTSTYDQQDPTLSIPRQLRNCHNALPDAAVIVAHFYDIESGRKALIRRGDGRAHELFQIPVPRDGGIQELLAEAERADRRFDVVICEEIGRIGRRSYVSNEIEHRLEEVGVLLVAADEPFQLTGTSRRKTSTQVLTRRVKQGVAEWYVIEMLEKSWDGFETHTEQAVGQWTGSSARDMLTNPKHTGHMVWNRRARKGGGRNRPNPVSEWVWSPEPTHEPNVDLETFVQAQLVGEQRERSRSAGKSQPPQAKREYRLRSYLFCVGCGRRLYGKTKRDRAYYVCAPKKSQIPKGHPRSTYWVREAALVGGLTGFLAANVFGPYRQSLLADRLAAIDESAHRELEQRVANLRQSIADVETRSKRLVRSLEVADNVDQAFISDVNERRVELREQRAAMELQLAEAETEVSQAPNSRLLDLLPVTPVDLVDLPDALARRLFEALRLEIHYDHTTWVATCRITLIGATVRAVAQTGEAVLIQSQKKKGPDMDMHLARPRGTVCLAPPAGLEPATQSLEGSCSVR